GDGVEAGAAQGEGGRGRGEAGRLVQVRRFAPAGKERGREHVAGAGRVDLLDGIRGKIVAAGVIEDRGAAPAAREHDHRHVGEPVGGALGLLQVFFGDEDDVAVEPGRVRVYPPRPDVAALEAAQPALRPQADQALLREDGAGVRFQVPEDGREEDDGRRTPAAGHLGRPDDAGAGEDALAAGAAVWRPRRAAWRTA